MATLVDHAICSLAEAHTWLNIPTTETDDDDLLKELINSMTAFVENYIGRRVVVRTAAIVEYFNGDGSAYYRVENPPINTLTEIYIEDTVTLDSTDCADTDEVRYDPDTGEIWLIQYSFPVYYPRNCKITYKGGWAAGSVPYDLWQASRELLTGAYRLRDRQKDDIQSISSPTGESVTFFMGIMRPETKVKLDHYRDMRLV